MEPEKVLDEILYILWTGAPWRSLNAKGASHFQTVHGHFMAWARKGVFKRAYAIALRLMRRKGRRNQYYCIDTTFIKSIYGQDCVGRNPTDRGRNATKLSAMVDSRGLPVSLAFFPANVHDVHTVDATLRNRLLSPSVRGAPLYADKGYWSKDVRQKFCDAGYVDRVSKRGALVHRAINRKRNVVERTFSWLDKNRRLLVRYDATIVAYEAFSWLACMRLLRNRDRLVSLWVKIHTASAHCAMAW